MSCFQTTWHWIANSGIFWQRNDIRINSDTISDDVTTFFRNFDLHLSVRQNTPNKTHICIYVFLALPFEREFVISIIALQNVKFLIKLVRITELLELHSTWTWSSKLWPDLKWPHLKNDLLLRKESKLFFSFG